MDNLKLRRGLRLLQFDNFLTAAIFSVPVMNIFYAKDLGMNLAQVGLLQAAFVAAVLFLDMPTGWLADRYSRRSANFVGVLVTTLGFVVYAVATTFWQALVAEVVIGFGVAASSGAVYAMLDGYCRLLAATPAEANAMYAQNQAGLRRLEFYAGFLSMVVGGFLGAYSLRATLWLTAAAFGAAAVLAWFQVDVGERHIAEYHPLKDMAKVVKYSLHGHKPLAWAIFALAVGNETTHVLVWLFTPLMLVAGAPVWLIGIGWAISMLFALIGNWAGARFYGRFSPWQRLLLGIGFMVVPALILAADTSWVTLWLLGFFGMVRGWFGVVSPILVRRLAPASLQNSVGSVAASVARILYFPLILLIPALADISLSLALVSLVAIISLLGGVVAIKLRFYQAAFEE